MPDFKETKRIVLKPYDVGVPFKFEVTICSAADSNDGFIPFGDTLDSQAVKAYKGDTEVTNELINAVSRSGQIITVTLDYPDTSGEGKYMLLFQLTTAAGVKIEARFKRVFAEDE